MSNRDSGFLALGRFLVVERYRESQPPPLSTPPPRAPGLDRTGGHAGGTAADIRPREGS